jgi:hypothetical protein
MKKNDMKNAQVTYCITKKGQKKESLDVAVTSDPMEAAKAFDNVPKEQTPAVGRTFLYDDGRGGWSFGGDKPFYDALREVQGERWYEPRKQQLASQIEKMKALSGEQAEARAERDLEKLDAPMDGVGDYMVKVTPEERQRRVDDINIYAEANPHYRTKIKNLSPDLLQEKPEHAADLPNIIAPGKGVKKTSLTEEQAKGQETRQSAALERLQTEFTARGQDYYSRADGTFAFGDHGSELKTDKNDPYVALAMANMAEAKGWKSIKLSGHQDFRRQVWLEASLKSIKVQGYKPSKEDMVLLTELQQQRMTNTIEKNDDRQQTTKERPMSNEHAPRVNADVDNPKRFAGIVVAFGDAPYQNIKDNTASYFVTVDENGKKRTAWGIDLKRAIGESGVKTGDQVSLENKGQLPVLVKEPVRDKQGKKIGVREIQVHRNVWQAEKSNHPVHDAFIKSVLRDAGVAVDSPNYKILATTGQDKIATLDKAGSLKKISVFDQQAERKPREAEKTIRKQRGSKIKEIERAR